MLRLVVNPALSLLHAQINFQRTFRNVNKGEYNACAVLSIFKSVRKVFTEFSALWKIFAF